ncbi:hypothetical protein TSL1_16320 [Sulfurovum sp. TSL1]|nr:hypothetical protein TSL1_16320 [Sulfurovum sp. TSL1]
MIVIWVLLAIGLIFGFWIATIKLNSYSERLYGYAPVNEGSVLFGFLPLAILIAGQFGYTHGDILARVLSIVVALGIVIYMAWWISKKTSPDIAIAATIINATVSLALLILLIALAAGNESRCNHCGSYDCDCW